MDNSRLKTFFVDFYAGLLLIWRSDIKLSVLNCIFFIIQGILPIISLVIVKQFIDATLASKGNITAQYGIFIFLFVLVQIVTTLVTQYSSYYQSMHQQKVADDIATRVLAKAIDLDIEYYENPSFHDELHMVQQQALYRPSQFISLYQGLVQNIISVILFAGFLFSLQWYVPVILLVLSVPLAISKLWHGYRQFALDKKISPAQRKIHDIYFYLITEAYAKEVRIFNFGGFFISQFLQLKQYIYTEKRKLQFSFLKQNILIQFFEVIILLVIYFILINNVVTGLITIGGLVIYFQAFQRLQAAINAVFQSGVGLFQQQLYLQQVLQYLNAPSIIKNEERELTLPQTHSGIQVKELDFAYPGTQKRVLHNINMQFPQGKIVAIVGENGAGKTTLIKLLCRLYEVPPETIFIHGQDIRSITKEAYRANISAIFQDFGKYDMTIENNIVMEKEEKDALKMDDAINASGFMGHFNAFPQGYKTMLGRSYKKGEQLSIGQWQKLALARALYKDSNVIILDEPTSAMDPLAEDMVFKNLKENLDDKCVILITHRLYNLKIADHIYLLNEGMIAEEGSFDGLISSKGLFFNIYEKQIAKA